MPPLQETVLYHLIKRGVDMNKANNEGLTPEDIAKNNNHKECVKLIQQTLDPEETLNEDEGCTPLQNTQNVSVEVQAQIEVEESADPSSTESNEQINTAESSVGEDGEPTVAPPSKKKERKVGFLLEDETADKETENDNHELPDNVFEDDENEESDSRLSTQVQNSEPTVSNCIILYPIANLCQRMPRCHNIISYSFCSSNLLPILLLYIQSSSCQVTECLAI